ncbi:MAG: phosphoglycerate kinase [Chloroflexi bacterium RBG_16_60_22]|nr:MAG: phosphoglycerate kinase [Chloroflexi bacterium RBG_16_60_22]
MNKMTVRDIEVTGKRVLVRVDFNVPVDARTGAITDDSRIRAALPTIKYLTERNARVILISHLGRPKGKVVDSLRLAPVAQRLSQILGQQVGVAVNCIGPEVEKSVETLKAGDVLLLENLRFHSDEETGSPGFARALARLGDIFVNDAFGTSHRAHASIAGIAQYLPAVAGLLLEKEINTLGGLLENPVHPFTSIFGGAKVSDKVGMLRNIMGKVDCLLIGGGMAATFLKAKSYQVGTSLIEADCVGTAVRLIDMAEKSGTRLLLPVDVVVADDISDSAKGEVVDINAVPADKKIADIGPKTVEMFRRELKNSQTIFWNGPVGVAEIPQFAAGTEDLARLLPGLKAATIVGGGSTAEVIDALGLADKVTFVSTGGGASLKFLGGEELPGVVSLLDKPAS